MATKTQEGRSAQEQACDKTPLKDGKHKLVWSGRTGAKCFYCGRLREAPAVALGGVGVELTGSSPVPLEAASNPPAVTCEAYRSQGTHHYHRARTFQKFICCQCGTREDRYPTDWWSEMSVEMCQEFDWHVPEVEAPAGALGGVAEERAGRSPVPMEAASRILPKQPDGRVRLVCCECNTVFEIHHLGDAIGDAGALQCPVCGWKRVMADDIPF